MTAHASLVGGRWYGSIMLSGDVIWRSPVGRASEHQALTDARQEMRAAA